MEEANRFQKLVAEAKKRIKEISPNDAMHEVGCGAATLIDVRSKEDWESGHARGAKHLPRGEVELEINRDGRRVGRVRSKSPISISALFVTAAEGVAPRSSRRVCRKWAIAMCAPWPEGFAPGWLRICRP